MVRFWLFKICVVNCGSNKSVMKPLKYWKSIIWTIVVLLATTLPSSSIPKDLLLNIPHFDKLVHFALFFVLATFLLSEGNKLREQESITRYAILLAIIVSTIYGLAIELIQYLFLPTRSGSLYDFAANVLGALAAIAAYRLINRFTRGWI